MPLYPSIVLEVESTFRVPIPQLYIGEPSSGFTPGVGSASHVGSWNPGGLLNLQKAIAKVKTPCIEELFISTESY
jgi:hypothetical protein